MEWCTSPKADVSLAAWQQDVAAGLTRLGYDEWQRIAGARRRPRFLVGTSMMNLYVYLDPEEGEIVQVVADAGCLGPLSWSVQNAHYEPLPNCKITEAGQRMIDEVDNMTWPTWEFSW